MDDLPASKWKLLPDYWVRTLVLSCFQTQIETLALSGLQPAEPLCRVWTCQSPHSYKPISWNTSFVLYTYTSYWFCSSGKFLLI